ncbi:MAG: amidase, partial [Desulfarculaceae bacterium]|jgi:aspartyl-tRNA(Asn)/glutamyl-tRNA(Gln) amidotransferase subunit A
VDVLRDLKKGIKRFRLAFPKCVFWDNIHPEIEKAVLSSKLIFKDLGAEVEEIDFFVAREANDLNSKSLITSAEACFVNKNWLDNYYDQLDPIVSKRMIHGIKVLATEYLYSERKWNELRWKALKAMDHIDGLIVPTTCIPAKPVDNIDKDNDTYFQYNILYLRNTSIGNTLNLCAISVPCGFTSDGLPIGLMIYGKPYQEDIILRIGYAFQRVTDWHKKIPEQ